MCIPIRNGTKKGFWRIPEEKLIVTGFPRFDRYLPNQPADQVKKILFMTTWREWLIDISDEEFKESAYFNRTTELLNHEKINQLLKEQNIQVTVALHPFMKEFEPYFRTIKNDCIQFVGFDELSIGEVIQEMDMLLTDITSVSWDFLYLNKPIIFYLFDQADWENKRGIYLNLNEDLYGYKAKNVEEVYACLTEIIIGGVNYNKWYSKATQYFDYFDQNKCERLAARVLK
ncbi:CDP-glycerol glycerophosphotransferase family protein [Planococcus sp. CAU13]|uniref:CDP-glycerol glycerophosphotransferase family protein n=1 Tax=Planococcus sp. CAU13 TaxID=1541197 RepID=UPI001F161C9D|nr:CDP-glycerol glycerophosphotransferase family protein [Planococcus sp. CAU13]